MALYTKEERKQPHFFQGEYFKFYTCSDLSQGVVVKPIIDKRYYKNKELLARDTSCFIADWSYFTAPKLNGFSGLSRIKWTFE